MTKRGGDAASCGEGEGPRGGAARLEGARFINVRRSNDSDERLVARMAAGDDAALLELHARYAPHLMALMRRMVGG